MGGGRSRGGHVFGKIIFKRHLVIHVDLPNSSKLSAIQDRHTTDDKRRTLTQALQAKVSYKEAIVF